jgi:hypothetical protein
VYPFPQKHTDFNYGSSKLNEYEQQLLDANNPHWMLSYIKSQPTSYIKIFINAIKNSNSKSCNSGLKKFLAANEMLQ